MNETEQIKLGFTGIDTLCVGDIVLYFKNQDVNFWASGKQKKGLWRITDWGCEQNEVELTSLSNPTDTFSTDIDNVMPVYHIRKVGLLDSDHITSKSLAAYECEFNETQEFKTEYECNINEIGKDMKTNIVNANVDAVKVAGKVAAGNALNTVVVSKVVPQLPIMVRGYANTPIGTLVVANLARFAVDNFASNNRKAQYAADAMMQAAMVDMVGQFNFDELLTDLLDGVEFPVDEVVE